MPASTGTSRWRALRALALMSAAVTSRPVERGDSCRTCHIEHTQHLPVPDLETLRLSSRGRSSPPLPVRLKATVPTSGVSLLPGSFFQPTLMQNIDYLLSSFDVDHMLLPFRTRAGMPAPAGARPQVRFWDDDLKGSNAGRFLMGAGNTLRWIDHPELRQMMNAVVDGVATCRNDSGYILAYPPEGFMHSEQGDYARSWFTQGLIEAGKAGNEKVWHLLRGMYDWFNNPESNPYLPYLYDGISNGEQGQIASTRVYLETPIGVYRDSQTAQDVYRDDAWMRGLISRDTLAITKYHMPSPNHPHCYEITSFLAMFDNYRATHNATWLDAAQGAWDLIDANFIHVDGSSSLTEGSPDAGTDWKAKSYRIAPGTNTGELCCTTFWIRFNQRFQLMDPDNETYADRIETAVYNAAIRNLVPRQSAWNGQSTSHDAAQNLTSWKLGAAREYTTGRANTEYEVPPSIRYHAVMEGVQEHGNIANTCCEGQGTRLFGSLPEYIYSLSDAGVYVNLYSGSKLVFNATNIGPVPVPPTPFRPLPPPRSHLTFQQIAASGRVYPGAVIDHASNGHMPSITSLEQCKSACLNSTFPDICMGVTWVSSQTPPPPKPCNQNCKLLLIPGHRFFQGVYYTANARSEAACKAGCISRPSACRQATWVNRTSAPCVYYSKIYPSFWPPGIANVDGWVLCSAVAINATECAATVPENENGCTLYRAIDRTMPANSVEDATQLQVVGRQIKEQHDWIDRSHLTRSALPAYVPTPQLQTPVSLTISTDFPYNNSVSIRLDWENASIRSVKTHVKLRIPSWLGSKQLPLLLNGRLLGMGNSGTYFPISRVWEAGDTISFTFPVLISLVKYTGRDQIAGYEGMRYAIKVGPALLACVGTLSKEFAIMLPHSVRTDPETWLKPIPGKPLNYAVVGSDAKFKPMWELTGSDAFTTYPVFTGTETSDA